MNLPNLISLGRLFSAPLMVWLVVSQQYTAAFWVFCVAGFSDLIDGVAARYLNVTTEMGKYLDPIADKALLLSVIVTLGFQNCIPSWLVILIVFRDILILGGILICMVMQHSVTVKPLFISKINTVLQIICAALILLQRMVNVNAIALNQIVFTLTAITTLWSGLSYVKLGLRGLTDDQDRKKQSP